MTVDRRSFLGVMAAAPIGVGGAVRKLTQRAGTGALLGGVESANDGPVCGGGGQNSKWDVFAKFGMPDWAEEELRNHNRPYNYEPDLEVLRSVSPVAKYHIQYQRNIKRARIDGPKYSAAEKLKAAFREKYNTEYL